ncbi:hypothetical protein NLM59_07485 [Weeksellaceae bacterium KMM 9724]|uniref:hypothetical protein n=1 Tax=Profundicola chukchiensis TaxID=2961959 RepID=UPI00243AA66F|nr:hypothetical protein [Profundicola chukchiensis]MDG4950763.1 hypothetical protein [Profundicola chukchiensis]
MEKHVKEQVLRNCNLLPISSLDKIVAEGHVTIEEFKNYNLEISKVNELLELEAKRNGTFIPEEVVEEEDFFVPNHIDQPKSSAANKQDLLNKILEETIDADDIKDLLISNVLSFDDLLEGGINPRIVNSLRHFIQPALVKTYTVDKLPIMEEGRTDLFFIGVPAAGKSTMLAGMMKYVHQEGIMIPDSYNNAGNVYSEYLISGINKGLLPRGTVAGSYNYIAASIKDKGGKSHPFNIVEVAGENYIKIFNDGLQSQEVKGFVDYIKNRNKKILIFVIDSLAHHTQMETFTDNVDQSIAYSNIISMFKDSGVLKNVDAIYLVANKFDAIMNTKYFGSAEKESDLAVQFLNEEFKSLINICKDARDNSKHKFEIKVFPFSIGSVSYDKILTHFEPKYSEVIVSNVLEDSFVVKGGKFWKF